MYNLKFGCQSYPWKMGKHFGQLPRMLKVAAEAGFQSIECEIDMLGTWFHDPEGVKKQLEKYNIEFAALVLHQDWNGMEETVEEAALSREAIEFVKHFPNAKIMLSHHAGNVPRGEGEALAERRKCLISCMASVAAKAAEAGIVCCFHPNSAKNSLFRTEEDYEAIRYQKSPCYGCLYGRRHCTAGGTESSGQSSESDFDKYICKCKSGI